MGFVKAVLKGIAILLALLVLVGIGFYMTDPPYWQRLFTAPRGEVWRVEWYQPQEPVAGVRGAPLPVGAPDARLVPALADLDRTAREDGTVALLVWHDGALRHAYYGEGFGPDTRTETASAHKTVVALLTGAAIADGVLAGVDQPVADFLPEWTDEVRKRIRIEDLLQMTSGLELITVGNPTGRGMKLLLGSDIPPIVLGLPSAVPPGELFEYTNTNPQLLGMALSRARGQRYAQYLSERLWQRIGAGDAALWLDHEGGTPRNYCCLFATGEDWLRVGRLLLDRGRVGGDQVVPGDWIDRMLTPSRANPNYGYFTWLGSPPGTERAYNSSNPFKALHSEPFVAPDVAFIDGFGGQRVYVVPSAGLIIVHTGKAHLDWDDARLPNVLLRALDAGPAP